MKAAERCPVIGHLQPASARHTAAGAMSNSDWWPDQLNLQILHQNSLRGNPLGANFNYAEEFKKLDRKALMASRVLWMQPKISARRLLAWG